MSLLGHIFDPLPLLRSFYADTITPDHDYLKDNNLLCPDSGDVEDT